MDKKKKRLDSKELSSKDFDASLMNNHFRSKVISQNQKPTLLHKTKRFGQVWKWVAWRDTFIALWHMSFH